VSGTPELRIGTSAFTAAGWEGAFYPEEMRPTEYLTHYATHFDTVEVDSTFYRTPSASTVKGWYNKTPPSFVFALKVPQVITHERRLLDCEAEFDEFVARAGLLYEKLGPLLIQFPYFNKTAFATQADFVARLTPFLKRLPNGINFALEIRNKNWLEARFADLLREHRVALALIDQAWMPRPAQWFEKFDPITANFAYIRLLGDRKGIEEKTKRWDKVIIDRTRELREWIGYTQEIIRRGIPVNIYVNNHFAGHAPATVRLFHEMYKTAELPSP
jgi:uncharacterized protein YecE (DUF72 family)